MVVSLYTSRIVLNTLGIEDYGIYNVVGGIVTMLGFLNNAMATGTQRFLTFELGKENHAQLAKVFSMSVNIHATIAIVVLILAETIGLWFLNTQLNIPTGRMDAAKWVYQFSIFTFIVTVMSVPYNALIIAHERMSVYAYVSIVEVILKLVIVFMLQWFGFDKLKLFAILVFLVSITIRGIYGYYSNRHFKESKYRLFWDRGLYKTLIGFAGWNLWGNLAAVTYGQGVNMLLNIFFGPAINAARGVAYQVKGAINGFVYNFQVAMNPQIVKSFAAGDLESMHQLIYRGSKYSFFLMFILSLPVLLETETILKLWLKIVPDYTVIFTRLVIINVLIDCISGPLMTAAQASGRIKLYQSVVGGLLLMILPISYLFLKLGFSPEITLYVSISISFIALGVRLAFLKELIQLKINEFISKVILRILFVICFAFPLLLPFRLFFEDVYVQLILTTLVSILIALFSVLYVGLTSDERMYFLRIIHKYKLKYFRDFDLSERFKRK